MCVCAYIPYPTLQFYSVLFHLQSFETTFVPFGFKLGEGTSPQKISKEVGHFEVL